MDYLGGPKCNHKGAYEREVGGVVRVRFEEVVLLTLKMEEGVTMQGM